MNRLCFFLLLAASTIASEPVRDGSRDFDFLMGEWQVHHRSMSPATREWMEYDGTCQARLMLDGRGNFEEHVLGSPRGTYRAVGFRTYDAKTGLWAIWWIDGRAPHGPVDPPVKGRFEDGVGQFFSDDVVDGKPRRTRYTWSQITPRSARWDQAYSLDGGKTWETNWVMSFVRK